MANQDGHKLLNEPFKAQTSKTTVTQTNKNQNKQAKRHTMKQR